MKLSVKNYLFIIMFEHGPAQDFRPRYYYHGNVWFSSWPNRPCIEEESLGGLSRKTCKN